ncbi:phosphoenolpyruvate--protein phosphotransferase [Kallotenue papyrolyticum]|uniref:phosphoenolpyruvate--protein phosphotransferase n=1 Tax=Kallotenue papyrolyticum TaxID=1325125 RepID=UPI0004786033|nr:phosphoenolpyruvate--protein phosphotransferase [Kallotenue papyrolyticum]
MNQQFRGLPGAPGIAIGRVAIVRPRRGGALPSLSGAEALPRFRQASAQVAERLSRLAAELRAEGNAAEAAIFDAQATLVADPALSEQVAAQVAAGQPLDLAVAAAIEGMAQTLARLDDAYLRERADDVRAIGAELLAQLHGVPRGLDVPAGAIVLAEDLTPAQTAQLRKQRVAGFATAGGTPTGHVAILARALGIPAVVGLGAAILELTEGESAILDADAGVLIVAPTARQQSDYAARLAARQADAEQLLRLRDLPAQTRDGTRVALWANIGHPDEIELALRSGAEGIGLFRTEFLFLDRDTPPNEDEQCAVYATVLRAMGGRPVIARTLDIGGDKPIPYLPELREANPFLGTRGLRFCMRFPELFQTQLRAMLRAALHGDLRIMLPMVATPEDVAWARDQLAQAATALAAAGIAHRADVPLGVMIETPAAAVALDRLAPAISFGSIGSNDLAQYTLAVDRTDAELGRRYRHDDAAVLRLIALAVQQAQRCGLDLSLCGELGADPQLAVALVGLGLRRISMSPAALPLVKQALRSVTLEEARARAAAVLDQPPEQR